MMFYEHVCAIAHSIKLYLNISSDRNYGNNFEIRQCVIHANFIKHPLWISDILIEINFEMRKKN